MVWKHLESANAMRSLPASISAIFFSNCPWAWWRASKTKLNLSGKLHSCNDIPDIWIGFNFWTTWNHIRKTIDQTSQATASWIQSWFPPASTCFQRVECKSWLGKSNQPNPGPKNDGMWWKMRISWNIIQWSVRHPCGCGRLPFEALKPWLRPADEPNPPWAGIVLGFACLGGVSLCRMCYRSAPFSRHVPHPLCCTHGFGSFLSTPVKNVLHRGTFAEPERYLCSIFAVHNPGEKVLNCGNFAQSERYLCRIFAVHSPVEKSFWLWHFCRARKLLMQYLCCAHGFGTSLSILLKNVLLRSTLAKPWRYLCSIFAMHVVLGRSLSTSHLSHAVLHCRTMFKVAKESDGIFSQKTDSWKTIFCVFQRNLENSEFQKFQPPEAA